MDARPSFREHSNRFKKDGSSAAIAILVRLVIFALAIGTIFAVVLGGLILVSLPPQESWFWRFLKSLVEMSPWFLVDLVGVILALVWWRRHPRVSFLTLLAIGLSVSVAVGGSFLIAWLPDHLRQSGWTSEKTITLSPLLGLIRNTLGAIAFLLILSAIFTDRSSKNRLQRQTTTTWDAETRESSEAQRPVSSAGQASLPTPSELPAQPGRPIAVTEPDMSSGQTGFPATALPRRWPHLIRILACVSILALIGGALFAAQLVTQRLEPEIAKREALERVKADNEKYGTEDSLIGFFKGLVFVEITKNIAGFGAEEQLGRAGFQVGSTRLDRDTGNWTATGTLWWMRNGDRYEGSLKVIARYKPSGSRRPDRPGTWEAVSMERENPRRVPRP
jgi:hypothetical protein